MTLISTLTLFFSIAAPTFATAQASDTSASTDVARVSQQAQLEAATVEAVVSNAFKGATEGIFLIRLADAPLAAYDGGIDGLAATSPAVTGDSKLDVDAPESVAYVEYLEAAQATFVARMERTIGHEADVRFTYKVANNGLAVSLTPEEATRVMSLPGVIFVQPDAERELHTDVGPTWIGADGIWGDPACDAGDTCGEGIIVGVIDTGINPENPSFADVGGDAYNHTNPFGSGNYVGVCDPANAGDGDFKPYDATFPCNDKLIGAWGFDSIDSDQGANSPWDYDGHGSHTASTAAGNFVTATISGDARAPEPLDISGVAPHANIIMYAGCCTLSALTASIDQAVTDGVDVINYSIGSPSASDVWNDFDTVGFLNARDAGIFVATSAGNEGPGAATLGSPADAPWLTAAAASTHSRTWANVVSFTGGDTSLSDIDGNGFTDAYGPAPIVYAGDFGDAGCLDPFPAGTWTSDEIVVCDRGTINRVDKGINAAAGGAGGLILANTAADGLSINADAHVIPASHITFPDGEALKAWLATGTGHMASITAGVYTEDVARGDILASFSSRGENRAIDIVSPSVSAPGVDIIAAHGQSSAPGATPVWDFSSGTSMASPHVAGAGALLMQQHPDWTPAEIQSALMLTSDTGVLDSDETTPATPFGMGSGRIVVDMANTAGLVMDETTANYVGADPATGGDPKTLNLASMANSQCVLECSWERTVTATTAGTWDITASADGDVVLSVTPTSLTLGTGESGTFTVTADVSSAPSKVWAFGEVSLTSGLDVSHLPVAVRPTTGDFPALVEIEARRDAGSTHLTDLTAIEIEDLTVTSYGLTKGDVSSFLLEEDETNDAVYDSNQGTRDTTVVVPDGALRLVVETFDTTAPDLDLYVGTGTTPSEATELCASATGSAEEYCNLDEPDAGTYWIRVQNWAGSGAPADEVSVSLAVVAGDEGNLSFDAPTAQPELEPFDADIIWDLTDPEVGDRYYGGLGLDTGATAPMAVAERNDIGIIKVDLDRVGDDVTKSAILDGDVEPGSVVTFEIVVEPNPTLVDIEYTIEDVLPDGLTYVPGSATGGLTEDGGTLSWTGVMPAIGDAFYTITDSDTDALCDTGFGGYVDLESFGIFPDSTVAGDTMAWTAFSDQDPFSFYDDTYQGISFTDDGFVVFGNGYGGSPWVPQVVPDPDVPNGLIAGFWHDFEILYDAGANAGVTLASAGPDVSIVEYDDVVAFGTTESVMDMSVVLYSAVDNTPGFYEAVVAFDNVSSTPVGTIGVENVFGTVGTALLNNADSTGVISDGYQVCFDLTPGLSDPAVLTFDAVVHDTPNSVITNEVTHNADTPGAKAEVASYDLQVGVAVPPEDGASLTAKDVLAESLTLMWDAASDASGIAGYHVYQGGTLVADVDGDVTEYAVSGLTGSTAYQFEVVAEDVPGNLSDGLTLTVTTATDFIDDDFSIFEKDIEWLSGMGITKGCNPPANDMYCPEDTLTRGELAAMINRALDLPATSTDYFTDDDDSIFENDINRLAEAGITKGCNQAGTSFCPNAEVTRGEIAAFFDRALDLPESSTDHFTDDDDSIFEHHINDLAEAGITRGCNPPANDNYCPDDLVTRGQIAAFFHRALG